MCVVGGDFITQPYREDAEALSPLGLHRWGPDGDGSYMVLVPPRPHLVEWFTRARQQVAVEAPGTWISVCCVVPREKCGGTLDLASLRKLVPQAVAVLDDATLEVRVAAVGERPPVVRVPAAERVLPPREPERAQLPRSRVLVVVSFRRREGQCGPATGRWIRGSLPAVPEDDMELLRLEFTLAPATRQQAAERALRAGVRRVATALGLQCPVPSQLRQLQPVHGGILALLGVPRTQACRWLCGSGCGGLYIRPFWTEATGASVDRSQFTLLWLRGRLADGARIWDAVHSTPGVFGLLASSKDVAVRVSTAADLPTLQAQLQFTLGEQAGQFRRAVPGQRWWRFGPLRDAELWVVKELVAQTELTPLRGELRTARAGPFRSYVYFAASGTPSKMSLDDGSWGSSEAYLQPAEPPPRRTGPKDVVAVRSGQPSGRPALSPQSTWGGARPGTQASSPQPSSQPVSVSAPPVGPAARRKAGQIQLSLHPSAAAPASPSGSRQRHRQLSAGSPSSPQAPPGRPPRGAPLESRLDEVLLRMDELARQNAALLGELGQLRRENAELRRQLEALLGVQTHQPYAQPRTPRQGPAVPTDDAEMVERSPEKSTGSPDPKRQCTAPLGPPTLHDV